MRRLYYNMSIILCQLNGSLFILLYSDLRAGASGDGQNLSQLSIVLGRHIRGEVRPADADFSCL